MQESGKNRGPHTGPLLLAAMYIQKLHALSHRRTPFGSHCSVQNPTYDSQETRMSVQLYEYDHMAMLQACRTAPYVADRAHTLFQQAGQLRLADVVINRQSFSTFPPSEVPQGFI